MTLFPTHGRIACRLCWEDLPGKVVHEFTGGQFQFRNNPGAWGGRNPKIAVLGQTKGMTQSDLVDASRPGPSFDAAAFAGSRPALLSILKGIGLCGGISSLDHLMKEDCLDWHWGSLIRCSLFGWDNRKDKHGRTKGWSSSSTFVGPAYEAEETRGVSNLTPERQRRVQRGLLTTPGSDKLRHSARGSW